MKTAQEFNIDEVTQFLESPVFDDEAQEEMEQMMHIDLFNLNECCVRQVDIMMRYSSNYERALAEETALKAAVERAKAELDPKARIMLESRNDKPTESKVEAAIRTTPDFIAIQTKYLAATKNTGLWKAARDTAMHRKDMLIQLASNYRAENTGDVSIKTNMQHAKEILKKQ